MIKNYEISEAMTIKLNNQLRSMPKFAEGIRRAPDRGFTLNSEQAETALKNVLISREY